MSWQIVFTSRAKKDLQAIPSSERPSLYRAIQRLAEDYPNLDIKKLWAEPPQWRLRVGKWRVIYTKGQAPKLDDSRKGGEPVPTITILNIFDRKQGY